MRWARRRSGWPRTRYHMNIEEADPSRHRCSPSRRRARPGQRLEPARAGAGHIDWGASWRRWTRSGSSTRWPTSAAFPASLATYSRHRPRFCAGWRERLGHRFHRPRSLPQAPPRGGPDSGQQLARSVDRPVPTPVSASVELGFRLHRDRYVALEPASRRDGARQPLRRPVAGRPAPAHRVQPGRLGTRTSPARASGRRAPAASRDLGHRPAAGARARRHGCAHAPRPVRRDFLRRLYPRLVAQHQYLHDKRVVDEVGLAAIVHPWESGLDNSPPGTSHSPASNPLPWEQYTRRDTNHAERPNAPATTTTPATSDWPPPTETTPTTTPPPPSPSLWKTPASTPS